MGGGDGTFVLCVCHPRLLPRLTKPRSLSQLKIADFGLARSAEGPDVDVSKRVFPISVR